MSEVFTQGHALILGTGDDDIPATATDATGIANILKDPARCAYPEAQVRVVTGPATTRQAVIEALEALQQAAGEEATVVFFYSGHGGYIPAPGGGKEYFLKTRGFDIFRPYETGVSGKELAAYLGATPAKKMLLLFDCCYAGGFGGGAKSGEPVLKNTPIPLEVGPLLGKGRGRVIIASSRENELSYAGRPYSAFTSAIIEACAGAGAAKEDGLVRWTDLALHAREVVPRRTKYQQHPVLPNIEGADDFPVAFYAGGELRAKGAPFPEPEIEPSPGAFAVTFNQQNQTVHGPQTSIAGPVQGPVYSGSFGANASFGGIQSIDTSGGAYIAGSVSVGRDFVGRDKNVQGDQVFGDKISVGDITGTGIAIGRNANANVSTGLSSQTLAAAFAELAAAVQGQAGADQRDAAMEQVAALQAEMAKGKQADDTRTAKIIDGLAAMVPGAVGAIVSTFANPLLGGLTGPVTKFVLDKLQI
jgi:hypothetical protein